MRKILFMLFLISVMLGSGYAADKDNPPADYQGQIAERPKLVKGDRWEYMRRGRVLSYEFVEEQGGKLFAPTEIKSRLGFPKGALRNWPNLDDIELKIAAWGPWTMNLLVLKSVDEERGEATTTLPATYPMDPISGGMTPLRPEEGDLLLKSAWVENVPEALDEPGEWVLNTHEGRLYLWPRGDSPGKNITAPRLTELIRVEGKVDAGGPVDRAVLRPDRGDR